MQLSVNNLLKNKLTSILNFNNKTMVLLFVGNYKFCFDSFSQYVYIYFKNNLEHAILKSRTKIVCVYSKVGIYKNLPECLALIKNKYDNCFIIAIDSSITTAEQTLGAIKINSGGIITKGNVTISTDASITCALCLKSNILSFANYKLVKSCGVKVAKILVEVLT